MLCHVAFTIVWTRPPRMLMEMYMFTLNDGAYFTIGNFRGGLHLAHFCTLKFA